MLIGLVGRVCRWGGQKMIVNIMADLAVLLIAVLFFFLTGEDKYSDFIDTTKERWKYIVLIVLVGLLLLRFSVVIEGARYDYRFLLYILAIKYIGPKVTLPSIFVISVLRFFWGVDMNAVSSFLYGMVLILTLSFVNKLLTHVAYDFLQLLLATCYTLFVGASLNLILYHDFFKDGQIYIILLVSSGGMVAIFLWIIKQIQRIRQKSEVDYLTELKNSRRFYFDISRLKTSNAYHLCVLDIDFFKIVNDTFGHLSGDMVLKIVADVLCSYQSPKITFYRIGGEEFLCLAEGYSDQEIYTFMEKVREAIAQADSGLTDAKCLPIKITVSIGISQVSDVASVRHSLNHADKALYQAKESGRNCVRFFSSVS